MPVVPAQLKLRQCAVTNTLPSIFPWQALQFVGQAQVTGSCSKEPQPRRWSHDVE